MWLTEMYIASFNAWNSNPNSIFELEVGTDSFLCNSYLSEDQGFKSRTKNSEVRENLK